MSDMTIGPVTFDDVRQALGDQDPAGTNAGALRKLLGRGSLSTIQRHLDALRVAQAAPVDVAAGDVPKPPSELLSGLWAHAWAAAQSMVQSTLMAALSKAEALTMALATAQHDATAAQQEADEARDALAAAEARIAGVVEQVHAERAAELEAVQVLRDAQAQAHADVQRQAAAAQAALELAQTRHALELATLRGELDRQISVMADLRAALQVRAAPAPVVAADPTHGDRHPE